MASAKVHDAMPLITVPQPTSKAEQVYRLLRQRILSLELKPGAAIRKDELAEECGVSRSPVSEALSRLEAEGLVIVAPQHGSFVAPLSVSAVAEGAFVRIGLECEAARRFAVRADESEREALAENTDRQAEALAARDFDAFFALDEEFHGIIFAPLGFQRTWSFVETSRAQLDRVRRQLLPKPGRMEATLIEHRRILEAVRLQDQEFAASAMRHHLSQATTGLAEHITQGLE
jgi:DNA-binding GntR family transcriptional regulator